MYHLSIEGVNVVTSNTYTLHTLNDCTHPGNSSAETGIVTTTDCFNATNGNSGCSVREITQKSYGEGFSFNGGGAFATLWNTTGISTWFFPVRIFSIDPLYWTILSHLLLRMAQSHLTFMGALRILQAGGRHLRIGPLPAAIQLNFSDPRR
jgi:hypothetical protein